MGYLMLLEDDLTEPNDYKNVRRYAQRVTREHLSYSSEKLRAADRLYVGWLDLMGAGHMMSTSIHKTANFLTRLHMAVEVARDSSGCDVRTLPINDGIFLLGPSKGEMMTVIQHTMVLLASRFISTPRPHDRCLMKGAIAYGPVYSGQELSKGITKRKMRENSGFLDRVMFGPPIIQAYRSEGQAPPYGIAVHESAKIFLT
jgi:hypothetical protein